MTTAADPAQADVAAINDSETGVSRVYRNRVAGRPGTDRVQSVYSRSHLDPRTDCARPERPENHRSAPRPTVTIPPHTPRRNRPPPRRRTWPAGDTHRRATRRRPLRGSP